MARILQYSGQQHFMKYLYLFFFPAMMLSSCILDTKYRDNIQCISHNKINLKFTGFDSTETDTLELRTYKPNGSFSELIASKRFCIQKPYGYYQTVDTAVSMSWCISDNSVLLGDIKALDDVELVVPATGNKYRFYSIVDTGDFDQVHTWSHAYDPAPVCARSLQSYKTDGKQMAGKDVAELVK